MISRQELKRKIRKAAQQTIQNSAPILPAGMDTVIIAILAIIVLVAVVLQLR